MPPYLVFLEGPSSWIGLALSIVIIIVALWKSRHFNQKFSKKQGGLFLILLVCVPLTSLFMGVSLPVGNALVQPGLASDPIHPLVMFFAGIPWLLAAGMLGPIYAAVIALLSGILRAYFHTHHLFTPILITFLAILTSLGLRQNFRTTFFQRLRHPLIAILPTGLVFPALHLLFTSLSISGELVSRVDYSLSILPGFFTAQIIELLIAAIFAESLRKLYPAPWVSDQKLQLSPTEKSLQTRFLVHMSPLALVLIIALMAGAWYQAGRAAKNMLSDQMENTAQVASDYIPLFLGTGQDLVSRLSQDVRLQSTEPLLIQTALAEEIKTFTFFDQLILLDSSGNILSRYPDEIFLTPELSFEEKASIDLALTINFPIDYVPFKVGENQRAAGISFIAPVQMGSQSKRVIIARSILENNPISSSILSNLGNFSRDDGNSLLIDERNRILVNMKTGDILETYDGPSAETAKFFDHVSPAGTRQFLYYHPVIGRPWTLVLSAPASRTQQIAIDIAGPLLILILILAITGIFITRMGLKVVTASLKTLAVQAGRIAEGRLDHPLPVEGEDEVGQLRWAFEQMRLSLKARLDELNRLLIVSQGVASSLEISEAIQPILDAALVSGASFSRIVLLPAVVPELDGSEGEPLHFCTGPDVKVYREWDDQILAFTRQQDRLALSNTSRPRLFHFNPAKPHPKSLVAIALRHENKYYGVLWVGYNQPHTFTIEEVQFLTTLGSYAASAAANARLFLSAETGRQRLAAILASSPDPILVTDQRDCLLLSNPAAWQVLGMNIETNEGKPIQHAISQGELVELLKSTSSERQSKEILLPDQRVFMATATPVLAEGLKVGRVCVMRDVSHFKQLDSLKTDFVASVSHDLRSPLTMMRGYATMLDGLGTLNEQQSDYVGKIIEAVEEMTRLVNNLLDLGRIEAGIGLQLEMVSADEIVGEVMDALRLQAAQKRIQITTDIPEQDLPAFQADRALLQQALRNLVDNAIKYSRVDGKVQINAQVHNSGVVFQVMDRGAGISPMDLPRLFEKFYRGVQQSAKDTRGSGLGLAIVKSIAEKHGGTAWAESDLGKGSNFYLSIPLGQPRTKKEK